MISGALLQPRHRPFRRFNLGLANNLALTLGSDSSIIAGNIFTDNNVLQTLSVSLGQGAMYYGQGTVVEDTAIGLTRYLPISVAPILP